MSIRFSWKSEDGERLVSQLDDNLLGPEMLFLDIPDKQGIYMWKLKPIYSGWNNDSWATFIDRLDNRLFAPIAEELPSKDQPTHRHRVFNLGLEIRGKKFPQSKRNRLDAEEDDLHQKKRFIGGFCESLNSHVPALYVGESGNLRNRIKDHLSGHTGFGKNIADHDELHFKDMNLFYLELGDQFENLFEDTVSDYRTTLEWIATMVTLSGYTKRAG